ncbi:DUF4491 domain-containing protein [Clostridium tetani]|uniref:DUF4491 domain-containing protein n=1 Tax=Clostridium tetani TaxID=1513 RepID=A0A4Q0VGG8_CLOTA|nr:DUF4491 family protein [Clostridium tetani]RXI50429.1 DUF4491 domain-containing protein [Clostridium tetani]BDR66433.1 DUF4491 domain-containing protein [Clostridium tetani]BDR69241.1 DUF4491 domain-containing protein [Clostridium tetani]BDR71934.1 DUF4491 domain-containing protein [Clostridium tetani]BDR80410.1 DUF4491 domain-containing protein [Clostridium tetani]
MNYYGIIIGFVFLLLTGVGHVIVIKSEYYFGTKVWPLFLIIAVLSLFSSLKVDSSILSGVLGINGFVFLWAILELFQQKERVKKGWFPNNPKKLL